jgi:hypothetical protein
MRLYQRRFFAFAAALVLSIAPQSSFARTYYVAQRDTLSADGTIAHPYPRIQQAAALMVAGDTCYIREGTYRETVRPSNSGSSGSPLVFKSFPNEKAVVNGCDVVAGTWTVQNGNIYKIAYTGPVNDLFVDTQCMLQARHPNMPYDSVHGGFVMLMPQDNAANPPAGVDWTGVIRIHDGGTTWVNKIEQSNVYANDGSTILIGPPGLLDSEGEWAFKNNTLYLWAPRGGNPGSRLVEAKSRDYGFNLQSRNYVTVTGITFMATSLSLDQASNCIIDSCKVFYPCPLFLSIGNSLGFNRENAASAAVNGKGVVVGGSNNVIRTCEIAHSWGDGVTLYGTGNTIENCHIYDCDWSGTDCAVISTGGSNHSILRNTLHDGGRCILLPRLTANIRIEYNDMFGLGWLKADLGIIHTFATDGKNSIIAHNWMHECYSYGGGGAGIYLDNGCSNYIVHHNAVWSATNGWNFHGFGFNTSQSGNRWYNNTLDNVLSQYTIGTTGWRSCNFTNNILQRTFINGSPSQVTVENNYEDSIASPQFVDPDGGDYRLKAASPCIDKGKAISPYTDGFSGTAPDQGAYEYGATAWIAGASMAFRIWTSPRPNGALSRRGWKPACAVNGSWAMMAFDGRLDTRWETYSAFPTSGPRSYFVNMQKQQTFNGIVLYNTARPDQTIKAYEIYVSIDGNAYGAAIASGTGSGSILTIVFPTQTGQYIKIVNPNTGFGPIWAIEELFVVYDTARARTAPAQSSIIDRGPLRAWMYAANGAMVGSVGDDAAAEASTQVLGPGLYVVRMKGRNGPMRTKQVLINQRTRLNELWKKMQQVTGLQ